MNHVIHLSEIIGTIDDGVTEVCATADAEYDSSASKVSVSLDAFARRVVAAGNGHLSEPWLPQAEVVTEHLSRGDASNFARDVFYSWTRKVRSGVPTELHLQT
jgi:hypothetical protein